MRPEMKSHWDRVKRWHNDFRLQVSTRGSKTRRLFNLFVVVFLGAVTVISVKGYMDNIQQADQITTIQRSDCKTARQSGNAEAQESCNYTLNFNDETRSIPASCIQIRKVGYPCPLTDGQKAKLIQLLEES